MKVKVGECFYNDEKIHFVIAVVEKENKILMVSITSKDYDKTCKLETDDIIDNNGKEILTHTSYISYKNIYEFEGFKTFEKFREIYKYKCDIEPELLKRIQNGAKKSKFTNRKFKRFFY